MSKFLSFLFVIVPLFHPVFAQVDEVQLYPVEQGRILYEYEGNTEGVREIFFRDFGKDIVQFTNLSRSSTFFAITSTTTENVVEYLKEGVHYHFDLEMKKGLILKSPIGLTSKYFQLREKSSYRDEMLAIGAKIIEEEVIMGLPCEHWQYRTKDVWIWKGLLIKMKSTGLNKNFRIQAVELDFEQAVADEKFVFPEGIPVPDAR